MSHTYHFIGIGGIGMSGLARILLSKNYPVSGSDLAVSYSVEGLVKAGAVVHKGHSADIITREMTVVYGSDIRMNNPEYTAAIELGCPLLHRSDLLAFLSKDHRSFAVAGTHGKTTVSALLSSVFVEAGLDPSFAVGGMLPQFGTNALHGKGNDFILEADESDGTFLKYFPFGAIVTNIDNDHLNNYDNSEKKLEKAFLQFMSQVRSKEHLFWCGEDPRLRSLHPSGISYGFSSDCDWQALHIRQEGFSLLFDVRGNGREYKDISLSLIGSHNVLNALAVFGLAVISGIEESAVRKAFSSFAGVLRRCEKKGETGGVLVLDDYAHHPTEVETTLRAIRAAVKERRIIVVFQPHRYSRTKDCLGTYGRIFNSTDEIIITDIFAAGETPIENLSYRQIMDEVTGESAVPIRYVPRSALNHHLTHYVRPHDVVVTMGAGDITKLGAELIASLEKHSPRCLQVGLIFGGSPTEHEVSVRSAEHFRDSLSKDYYTTKNFTISKRGIWTEGSDSIHSEQAAEDSESSSFAKISSDVMSKLSACDVLIPVLHGPGGEDGVVQGFFDTLGKAYVGCNHRAASLCMDKVLSKMLVSARGMKTSPFIHFSYAQWQKEKDVLLAGVNRELHYPVFVKPSHLGSSVGVTKVENAGSLREAIESAFRYDTDVLVENGILGREIEFAVLGNDEIVVFPPGEVLTDGAVYDYDAKYAANGIKAIPRADIENSLNEEGRKLAGKIYSLLGCSGLARVDFFLDREGEFWFNEINPMPGFTSISLYPQICALNGLPASELIDRLIVLALHRKRQQDRMNVLPFDAFVHG